ncbi:MAG: DUF4965 domain-containing protein [Alistipes sp.]|nr:DUF4965 domain-containing protein [Alistipes sp.]
MMKKLLMAVAAVAALAVSCSSPAPVKNEMRAPAYPLITIDPYTSAWSPSNNLYDAQVMHWTEKKFPFVGTLRVDGQLYRFMGQEEPTISALAPMSVEAPWWGTYTFDAPRGDAWTKPGFNDKSWKKGEAAFGLNSTNIKTVWDTKNIWVRREVEINPEDLKNSKLFVMYSHDDNFELYLNGTKIVDTGNAARENVLAAVPEELLKDSDGKLTFAAHCYNGPGLALVDFGLYKQSIDEIIMSQTAVQTSADVQATRTIYDFTCGGVDLTLTFAAPLFMEDLELVSRPVNYVTYAVKSNDGAEHDVEIYFEASADWARNMPTQKSISTVEADEQFNYVKSGTESQRVLAHRGDDIRIDWGYFYMAADKQTANAVGCPVGLRKAFAENGEVESKGEGTQMALSKKLGKVGAAEVSNYIMVGYDDLYSIQYFNENIRPYWNRKGDSSIQQQFALAAADYEKLMKRCEKFDAKLMADAAKSGGKEYAELCALAYRQAITAHKLIETPNGDLAWLSKENNSNGSIGTVDVTYPSAPMFLYYNPELAKGLLNFIFYYTESGKWTKPFAAHDVGTYPQANGQTYGGDMPVEECGNMLILTGAICQAEGNADYALKHWDALTTWTDYLVENGGDPANQLCTDDFAGHWARNANLAVKAIVGVAAYADMADMAGKKDIAQKYGAIAKDMAAKWKEMAQEGDHYRLTFDTGRDTWSQKYNLVWDKMLGYDVFDPSIALDEVAYYLTKQNEYGLPLDCRRGYTKSDWIVWTATMSPDKATFEEFIKPLHKFYNESTSRVPMSDWINTDNKSHVGFKARSVVGGYWIKMLADRDGK